MRILDIDRGLNTTGYGMLEFVHRAPRLVEAGVVWFWVGKHEEYERLLKQL